MKDWLGTAFSLLGAVIGAGMITGVEVRQYFGSSVISPLFIMLASALMAWMFWMILRFNLRNSVKDTRSLCNSLFGSCAPVMHIIIMLGAVITCGAMLAGVGTLMYELFNIPRLASAAVFGFIGSFCAMRGVKWLARVNYIVVPAIVVFMLVILISGGCNPDRLPAPYFDFVPYAAYNVALSIPLCCAFSEKGNEKIKLPLLIFFIVCAAVITAVSMITSMAPAESALPVLSVALSVSAAAGAFYSAGLFGAVITTYISGMFAFNGSKFKLLLATAAAIALSTLPLDSIVKYVYPISGISCIICLIRIIYLDWKNK